jgi:hypothetical protein
MKIILLRIFSLMAAALVVPTGAVAAESNPPPCVTVELRDGSRVVGECLENTLKFHSALLGDIKLDAKNVRMVECLATNCAKLTTTSGDMLTVLFSDSALAVKTSFGKVELKAASIRKFTVSATGTSGKHREGLVALWAGEGNAADSVSGISGELANGTGFAPGKIDQAFSLNEDGDKSRFYSGSYLLVPARPELNVGRGDGFTITAWILPTTISRQMAIVDFNGSPGSSIGGVCFWISLPPGNGTGSGCLYANIMESDGTCHNFTSRPRLVKSKIWQHIAVTYDKASGAATLYLNGNTVAYEELGSFNARTDLDILLGGRYLSASALNPTDTFSGKLDEVGLYNRALSADEIREDYDVGNKD